MAVLTAALVRLTEPGRAAREAGISAAIRGIGVVEFKAKWGQYVVLRGLSNFPVSMRPTFRTTSGDHLGFNTMQLMADHAAPLGPEADWRDLRCDLGSIGHLCVGPDGVTPVVDDQPHDTNHLSTYTCRYWLLEGLPRDIYGASVVMPGIGLLAIGVGRWRRVHRRRARLAGRCEACGYDLRASPDRCPECGAVPGVS